MVKHLKSVWGFVAPSLILGACVVSGASLLTTITSLVGVLFVIGVAFRIPACNLLGFILCVLLGYMSYEAGFIINMIVNTFILAPLQIIAYFQWKGKDLIGKTITNNINKYHLVIFSTLAIIYTNIMLYTGSTMPVHDVLSGALIITSTLLLMSDTKKQWYYWIPCNTIEVIMWFTAASLVPEVLAIAVMRVVFLVNSFIGWFEWRNK
ncbi:PnuC-like nicotinamide mononucleotide transport [Proteus phage Vb_PmiP-P59]|uniref:Nicotinate ribosyltransferase n=3 Tax=Privateervirus TaxID=2843440 RepID=A0A7L7SS11_9CAUD|nr:PnuC-like nicotinamide mononucleotide transport [Proteus phage Privateer]YP_010672177.1 PnuC-like nicotinamide mononucleotide transport [Proteus phage Vb_PmiP-P59]YP_010672299.1 PnuC-like nicotinamide mononucleotide transport [Proteus phage 3H10_20]QIN94828.1 nicotinate ribosyltransferase [Proteus phage Privateer]QMV48220.1 hypothetical protein [Proteus phage Vb_PmiP-P59]QOC54822.1 nicotinate ribosyltransferase [Proteus phage 3H10_20]